MTKSPSTGLALGNFFHIGNVSNLRKVKNQSKDDVLDFPTLISLKDANLAIEKLIERRPVNLRLPEDKKISIESPEAIEFSDEIDASVEKEMEHQEINLELPKKFDGPDSTVIVKTELEPRSDLAALWQHLNGIQKSPEVIDTQPKPNPLKLDLQNAEPSQKQNSGHKIELNVASMKTTAEISPERRETIPTPKFTKGFETEVNIVAEGDEDIQMEKIPTKVIAVETHFDFNTASGLGFQLGGAVADHLKGEVTKLQLGSSKSILDPNTALLKSLHIQLIPESLGELKVLMHLRGSELTLKIEVSSKLAAMKLTEDKDLLKELLEKAGFEMAGDPVLIVVRTDQSTNSDARMNDQSQDKQPAGDGNTPNYGKNFGDGNERQQKNDNIRNAENSPSMRSQELAEKLAGRTEHRAVSNSATGLYL